MVALYNNSVGESNLQIFSSQPETEASPGVQENILHTVMKSENKKGSPQTVDEFLTDILKGKCDILLQRRKTNEKKSNEEKAEGLFTAFNESLRLCSPETRAVCLFFTSSLVFLSFFNSTVLLFVFLSLSSFFFFFGCVWFACCFCAYGGFCDFVRVVMWSLRKIRR